VAFLPEPVAAALNYELASDLDEVILVVDIGGGTTDCAVIEVGPRHIARSDRGKDVLSHAGRRIGGVDMDFQLAWHSIMPYFGKDTLRKNDLPIPHPLLVDAISVNNFPAQERFRRAGGEIQGLLAEAREPQKLERLLLVWQQGLQFRLVQSAESAKIALSNESEAPLPLSYVDSELLIPVSQSTLNECTESALGQICDVAREAVKGAGARIDKIFLTGGASRSPTVIHRIRHALNLDIPVLRGDDFGSVTLGLTRHAHNTFNR
jgi:hypothetical chaperone protein